MTVITKGATLNVFRPSDDVAVRAKQSQRAFVRLEAIVKELQEELSAANQAATTKILAASGWSDANFRAAIGKPIGNKFGTGTFRGAPPKDWGDLAQNGVVTALVQRPALVFAFVAPDGVRRSGKDIMISATALEISLGPPGQCSQRRFPVLGREHHVHDPAGERLGHGAAVLDPRLYWPVFGLLIVSIYHPGLAVSQLGRTRSWVKPRIC